jgi:HAD superfamily hydrolase (TIGR01548 family)
MSTPRDSESFPSVIIFDIDGVLVGTRKTYLLTVLQVVKHFTGKRVTLRELHAWKSRPGFNDDWKLSHAWVNSLGTNASFEQVRAKFLDLYWGKNRNGNVRFEEWLLPKPVLRRLSRRTQLAVFTGRVLDELDYTFDRFGVRPYFDPVITVEKVTQAKPAPEGLHKILDGRNPRSALYVGDNVDDALAAKSAGVPFLAVLPRGGHEFPERSTGLNVHGALAILGHIKELEAWLVAHWRPNWVPEP